MTNTNNDNDNEIKLATAVAFAIVHHDHNHDHNNNGRASNGNNNNKPNILQDSSSLRPGAYMARRRATGEIPIWAQQTTNTTNTTTTDATDDTSTTDAELTHNHPLQAELSRRDSLLLIQGVKDTTTTTNNNSYCRLLYTTCCSIAVILTFTVVTLLLLLPTNTTTNTTTTTPTTSPTTTTTTYQNIHIPYQPSQSWTIAQFLQNDAINGPSLTSLAAGQLFLDILNQTDTNFTYFGIRNEATLLEGVEVGTIAKMISPFWNAHVLDILKSITVQGLAIERKDMYNNMNITSMAGYPLLIQFNPFRVNNNTIMTNQQFLFTNGIVYHSITFPNPLAPWGGISLWQTLLQINQQRQQDISIFIDLVQTNNDIYNLLLQRQDSTFGTTIFVPTNKAISTWNAQQQRGNTTYTTTNTTHMLLNHMIDGNFAKSCWQTMPTGTYVSNTELQLETLAANVLDLYITQDQVTINGQITILQHDIFSEQGILHIINKVLR